MFTEINSRYEKVINTSKQLREIILQAQQERTKILNEKKELKQQIKKLKEEKEKSLYEINDLESDLDISNEIIINKNGTIKGLVDKSNKQNRTINKKKKQKKIDFYVLSLFLFDWLFWPSQDWNMAQIRKIFFATFF